MRFRSFVGSLFFALFLAIAALALCSSGAWASLTLGNDTLGDTSNGKLDGSQLTFYYLAGHTGAVTAGIEITSDDTGHVDFTDTDSAVSILDTSDSDIKSAGINVNTTSQTIKVVIAANAIVNTSPGTKLKIGGEEITLIGQPITPGIKYSGNPDLPQPSIQAGVSHGRVDDQISLKVFPEELFFNSIELYAISDISAAAPTVGSRLPVGGFAIGADPGGIKLTGVSDGSDKLITFATAGAAKLEPPFSYNGPAFMVSTPNDLRIGNANGPVVAGYNTSTPTSLVRLEVLINAALSFTPVKQTEWGIQEGPVDVNAIVGGGATPASIGVTASPDYPISQFKFHEITEYEGGGVSWGSEKDSIQFNGLSITYSDGSIKITGSATAAGTKKLAVEAGISDNLGGETFTGSYIFTVSIAANSITPPPPAPVVPGPAPDPGETILPPVGPILPSVGPTIVEVVESAATENLAEAPTEVLTAERAAIKRDENVFAGSESIREFATSAISVNQPVQAGGAVIMATNLTMPVTGKSLSGEAQLKPEDIDELRENYSLNKYFGGTVGDFSGGNAVDLLQAFRNTPSLFSYSEANGLVINATIVVIDGPVGSGETGVVRPSNNSEVGVKLSRHEGGNFLYIFDGKKDGSASDPIALVTKKIESEPTPNPSPSDDTAAHSGSGSGGGCDAGFGASGLIALAGAKTLLRKKK
ncbi:hypothetical protein FACS1894167_13260 [Synergistales bacterium]|nr:hypothetical protein FACS1894167_13260 [Synergistales bacterium]